MLGAAHPLQIALEIVVVEEELRQRPVGAIVGLALQHVDIGRRIAAFRVFFRIGGDRNLEIADFLEATSSAALA